MPRPSNFTDRQKAELYVLYRATCAFSGRNLWLLDYGADPYYQIDWADHKFPVSKGGLSTIENGVCASCWSNHAKRDKTDEQPYLFLDGKPTSHFFKLKKAERMQIQVNMESFSLLHYSDWYFNRALWRLLFATDRIANEGSTRKRGVDYYSKAAWSMLCTWRRIVASELVPAFEERRLLPDPFNQDQKIMLGLRTAANLEEVRELAGQLLPFYLEKLDKD
jgi:hypothetical protein